MQVANRASPIERAPLPQAGDLIDEREVAAILGLSPITVRNWRASSNRNFGPPFIRLTPRCVRYRRSDVAAFIAAGQVASDGA